MATGGSPVRYSIPVSVSGLAHHSHSARGARCVSQPLPGATWYCVTGWNNTGLFGIGTNAFHFADPADGYNPGHSDLLGLLGWVFKPTVETLNNFPPASEKSAGGFVFRSPQLLTTSSSDPRWNDIIVGVVFGRA